MITASRKLRPGLASVVFLLAIGAMFGIMAFTGTWSPKPGLDLQGDMTITLIAMNLAVERDSLELARNTIQKRVDRLGIGKASVTTSGDRHTVASAPSVQRDDMVKLISSTAQLTFRPALHTSQVGQQNNDPDLPGLPTPTPELGKTGSLLSVEEVLKYETTEHDTQAFDNFRYKDKIEARLDRAIMGCDPTGQMKYLLGPAAIIGERVVRVSSGVSQGQVSHVVTLEFGEADTNTFSQMTTAMVSKQAPANQFAVVLDGVMQSASRVQATITNGQAQIAGSFTAEFAAELTNILKFGALPLNFGPSQVETVSPTLSDERLCVGLIAGGIGLALVILYCLAYYRGLGLAVVGSLGVAVLTTYASMVVLGEAMGFTLNPPAIAGAIVAIGMTADSFVVYFERIRDEMRDGRGLRSILTTGWVKTRPTILVADVASILSTIALFILAVGGVKGFAFSLGLTTLLNLAVCFFFIKPLVQLLGRTKSFGEGHWFSGLDASHMGVSRDSLLGRRSRRTHRAREA